MVRQIVRTFPVESERGLEKRKPGEYIDGMAEKRVNIYQFLDFREFMREYFEQEKLADQSFSLRTFLSKVSHSLSSSGLLSAVLKGTRNLSPALRLRFSQVMGLKDKE